MNPPTRVLITGLGSIGQRHARLLREHAHEFDIAAYRRTADGHSTEIKEYTTWSEVNTFDPELAFITNPTHKHVQTALKCARLDSHLLVEKPLSHTLANIEPLLEEVNDRGLTTLMGCQLRFDPVLSRVSEILHSGELGEIVSFRSVAGSYLPEWRPNSDYRDSYSADPDKGGGVVLDLIHEFDYIYWLFDDPTVVSSALSYPEMLDIQSEAVAEILLTASDGTPGSIHLDYCRRQPERTLEIVAEHGTVIADLQNHTLQIEYPQSTTEESYEYERDRRFKNQLDYFIDRIKCGDSCENDIKEGKEVLQLALEAKNNE